MGSQANSRESYDYWRVEEGSSIQKIHRVSMAGRLDGIAAHCVPLGVECILQLPRQGSDTFIPEDCNVGSLGYSRVGAAFTTAC